MDNKMNMAGRIDGSGDARLQEILDAAGKLEYLAGTLADEDAELSANLSFISRNLTSLALERSRAFAAPAARPEEKPRTEKKPASQEIKPLPPEKPRLRFRPGDDMITPVPLPAPEEKPEKPLLSFSYEITPEKRAEIRDQFRELNSIFPYTKFDFSRQLPRNDRLYDKFEKLAREFQAGGGKIAGKTVLSVETAEILNFEGVKVWESEDSIPEIAERFFAGGYDNRRHAPGFRLKRLFQKYGSGEWGKFAALPAALSDSGEEKLLLIIPCGNNEPGDSR